MDEEQQQVRIALAGGMPGQGGSFEVLAMTAGEGNGWQFTEQVLQNSLALWDGVETFVDHGGWFSGRSVRDLGGVCHSPSWDAESKGIKLQLKTIGPSGPLVEALAREWLGGEGAKPRLGFSADVTFTAKGREVKQIMRVISLDLVFNPARGGAFVRALNSVQEGFTVGEEDEKKKRVQLCASLLDATLGGAKLPAAIISRVRARFADREFEPTDLTQAIEDSRAMLGELQAGSVIQGPGRISGLVTAEERLQAAVDDMFGVPREKAMESQQGERLRGIRELYVGMTGDWDFHGGYYPSQARFATTATMPQVVKNALNKLVAQQYEELGLAGYRWWEKVVTVEHFESLNQITGVAVGEVGLLPAIAEGAEYTELPVADSAELGNWAKYGGYIPLTLELIDRDNLGKLKAYPRKMTNAAIRKLSRLVADVFTANAGVGPTMADTKALFHTDHANLGTTALAAAEWEVVSKAVYNQTALVAAGQTAPKLALEPKYCLVPRDLRLAAMGILYPNWDRASQVHSENLQQGQPGDVITVPEFTDATDWAAVCDPRIAPAIYIGERFGMTPEVFISGDPLSPAMFSNDEARLKVRFFCSVFVADYRPLYKENVA